MNSKELSVFVIPAEAGIQVIQTIWTPAFAEVTHFLTLYEGINIGCCKKHYGVEVNAKEA